MKIFFTLLLLTNIAFALVQWLFPYEQILSAPRPLEAAEKLKLVSEVETTFAKPVVAKVETAQPRPETNTPAKPPEKPVEQVLPTRLCYTLGPFKEQQSAQQVAQAFRKNKIQIKPRASQEQDYMGQMVYIGGHKTRDDALRTAESLAKQGVRDYIIVNEDNRSNILSLGVFSLKKNAEGRLNSIARLGYPVKSEPRYRNRTIYWLDYSETENENLSILISELRQQKGISRISRKCS